MCLREGNLEEVGPRGLRQVLKPPWMGFGGLFRCKCVGMYKEVFTSRLRECNHTSTHISNCQFLGSLGSRDS